MSMVVAPAYILHLAISPYLSFFSFGMAEYVLQALVLIVMMLILRRVKLTYFLSLTVAVFYGFVLDGGIYLTSFLPQGLFIQTIAYILGALISCGSIALLFSSYLPPEAYEMFVKEIAQKAGKPVYKIKTVYDFCSLAVAVALSLIFFGSIEGVGIGTVVCAIVYGFIIRLFQKLYNITIRFEDRFNWREYFEEREK